MTTGTRERDAGATHVDAFSAFHAAERDRLYRALAFALGDPSLAAEAVDEAMTRAYQRWPRVGAYADPAGWVYRVAVNWARSAWRRARRFGPQADARDAGTPGPALPDDELWTAVAALPAPTRDAVVLRFVLDWPYDRIAAALGVAPGTARSRVTRGVRHLRAVLPSHHGEAT